MRFHHLWWSLVTLFALFHVTPKLFRVTLKPCGCSVNVIRQVFCGLPVGLLPSSSVQFMATFAGLSSVCLERMTGQSHLMWFNYFRQVSFQTWHQLLVAHMVSPWYFHSWYTVDGKHPKCYGFVLSISVFHMHEVLSMTWLKCRGGTWQNCWWSVLTIKYWVLGCFVQSCTYVYFQICLVLWWSLIPKGLWP